MARMMIRLKTEEQLRAQYPYLYEDQDGDLWFSKKACKNYEHGIGSRENNSACAFHGRFGETCFIEQIYALERDTTEYEWTVDTFYTRESHPEYYL